MSVREWRLTDYYAVLGVSPRATDDEIDVAFRDLVKRWHPDRHGGDPEVSERFKRITAAHDVLGDPATRARYDRERALAPSAPAIGPASTGPATAPRAPGRPPRPSASWDDRTGWARPVWEPPPGIARPVRRRRTRRFHPRLVLAAGVLLLAGGLTLATWRVTVGRAGSSFGPAAVHTSGTIVDRAGHHEVVFTTADGAAVTTRPGGAATDDAGTTVKVVYDRNDPTRAVLDHDSFAKEITIWIAAVKLVVGGLVLIVVSRSQRLRRWLVIHARSRPVPSAATQPAR